MGSFFVGALAYADNLALLTPSVNAMQCMLRVSTIMLHSLKSCSMRVTLSVYVATPTVQLNMQHKLLVYAYRHLW